MLKLPADVRGLISDTETYTVIKIAKKKVIWEGNCYWDARHFMREHKATWCRYDGTVVDTLEPEHVLAA